VVHGEIAFFVWLNRGKESIVLDYGREEDAAVLRNMISRADVLIQNLGPGAAERAGFGWRDMRALNPRLITCDIAGFSEDGPYAERRAYDLMIQAESGMCSITGTHHAPGRIGVSAVDVGTGMYAHAAILEALYARRDTWEGCAIHVSMFGAMMDWMSVPLLHHDYAGKDWPRTGLGHPLIAPYGAYAVAGGREILVGAMNNGQWQSFASVVLQAPALLEDPCFKEIMDRVKHREALDAAINAILESMPFDEAERRMIESGVPYAAVNTVAEISTHPHTERTTVETPSGPANVTVPPAQVRGETVALGPVPALD